MAKRVKIQQLPNTHGPASAGSGAAGNKTYGSGAAPIGKTFRSGKGK